MKAVRSTGDLSDKVLVVDVDEPPGSGEDIEIRSASICASDFMYIGFGLKQILGHELAGVRSDGTPVVVEALFGCGSCAECRLGRYNLCSTCHERALGVRIDGGMAEHYRAPSERLVPLPPGLDIRDASIVEPATVSWHALRLARCGPDTRVAVVGAVALGLLAAAGARRQGAQDLAVDARHPHQQHAAERLGATVGASGFYDVVVEAAGTEESLARCVELVAPRGTIVVLGVHTGATVSLPWHTLFLREASVVPSLGYCAHDGRPEMVDVAEMLAGDPEIARTVITHRFPLEDAAEAFRVAADRSSGALRVVLEP
jgi:threonine dehydrogenase-like Zn-dependent dehydrogenase